MPQVPGGQGLWLMAHKPHIPPDMSWLTIADPEQLKQAAARLKNHGRDSMARVKEAKARAAAFNPANGGVAPEVPVDAVTRRAKRKAKRKRGK